MARRLQDEFAVSEAKVSKSARVHGVVTSLSPLKNNASGTTKYFQGQMSDEKGDCRLVGFDAKIHRKLKEYHESHKPVAVENCEVKEGREGRGLEVIIRNSSGLENSPSKFDISESRLAGGGDEVSLQEVPDLANFQTVCIKVKVIGVSGIKKVGKGLQKQNCVVADSTGSCTIILWEDNIDLLVKGVCYKLSGMIVRNYQGKKYLSVPRDNFCLEIIEDIGEVEEEEIEEEREIKGGTVVWVKYFDSYMSCYSCKGKITSSESGFGEYGRCGMMQTVKKCQVMSTAKVDIEADDVVYGVTMFSPVVEEICEGGEASKVGLLSARPFNFTVNNKNIVSSIIH